ncbi:MAG TPA: hypothetical protein PKW56_10315 [Clostridiales bacterium]|nr:hypothetical protein [Clostridiales bacterium]
MAEHKYLTYLRSILPDEFREIGAKMFANECASKKEYLVWWSPREGFANFGIGHFIWFPPGKTFPFVQQFPELIGFYLEKREHIPQVIDMNKLTGLPWNSKEELDSDPRKAEIIDWLASTTFVQAAFIIFKAMDSLKEIAEANPGIVYALNELCETQRGRYAVVDYLNFKGTGLDHKERLKGEGWGLVQVLEKLERPDVDSFIEAAAEVLKRRVINYTEEQNDLTFIDGWLKRLETYRT